MLVRLQLRLRIAAPAIRMATRSSSRRAASVLNDEGAMSSTTEASSTSTTTAPPRNSKRARYIPPPPSSLLETRVKVEKTGEDADPSLSLLQTSPTPQRYSLRRRNVSTTTTTNGVAVKSEQDIYDQDTAELTEETLSSSKITSPRKVVKKEQDLFALSPRKTNVKPIKVDLDASEARPAPKRWQAQYDVLVRQRKRIVAPVDTLGCEENGRDEKRQDDRTAVEESIEAQERRARFTLLISLMLSSQTKDPVTAEAVHNLQRNLPGGLCLESIIAASQDDISRNINKVGFWRRKTGYVQSAARIIQQDFGGDVPKTIDELCSLPGVGPKMGFLCLQGAWNINAGIGVDVHVHRVANRLGWVKSKDAEGTRLQLQSWLPKPLHRTINKTLVGFGQVICQPVGPRCDLCALGAGGGGGRLCPSYRRVDPKSIASRVKVELLPEQDDSESAAAVKVQGPEGTGEILVKKEELAPLASATVKQELEW